MNISFGSGRKFVSYEKTPPCEVSARFLPLIVATWNVNGIRARAESFMRWVRTHQPDILCLQEIKAHPSQIPEVVKEIPRYTSHWHGALGGYSGVSIHVREGALGKPDFTVPFFDEETRILQADLDHLAVLNVYVPLGHKSYQQKLDFLDRLVDYIDTLHYEGRSVVLCGDFNVAHKDRDVHPQLMGDEVLCTRSDERQRLDGILKAGMHDLFRRHHPSARGAYSWWPYSAQSRARNIGWRIDYIFVSHGLARTSHGCRIIKEEASSDHSPVVAIFKEPPLRKRT